jgi:Rod binding domain-containing protein
MTIAGNLFQPGLATPEGPNRRDRAEPGQAVQQAANQFEALLLAQLLRQVREAGALESDDESGNHLKAFAEEQLAEAISAQGGLGFARMAVLSLDIQSARPSQPATLREQ